jgi:phospholipid/cholesterol/gamma-HCH transport system ATP-binding protein
VRDQIIEFRDVRKTFGDNVAIDGMSCAFPGGRISALVGPSGAGKTTMLRLLLGLTLPDSGEVTYDGRPVAQMKDKELLAFRRDFGVLLEGTGALFASMSVFDNVAFPLRKLTEYPEELIRDHVETRLGEVGLNDDVHKMPSELSTGMRVRAAFARAVVMQPPVLFFDSPDHGMDPVRMTLLNELIVRHQRSHPCTCLMITHDLESVRNTADYMVLMHRGRLVEQGPITTVLSSTDPFTRQFLAGTVAGPLGMR